MTSAIVGPQPIILRVSGTNASSIHGEVMALIAAGLVISAHFSSTSHAVHLDHLQLICLIEDIHSNTLPLNFWAHKPAQSYYHWLGNVLSHAHDICFTHVKAHTSASDGPSLLNQQADDAASLAHYCSSSFPLAPIPTFSLDNFSLWCPLVGFIENNVLQFITSCLSQQVSHHLFFDSNQCMPSPIAPQSLTFPYEWSSAGYSAVIQLYACSGQLPTRGLLVSRGMLSSC